MPGHTSAEGGRRVEWVVSQSCGPGVNHSNLPARLRDQGAFHASHPFFDFEKESPMQPPITESYLQKAEGLLNERKVSGLKGGHALRPILTSVILCLTLIPAHAFNALVQYEDIPKMREAGVGQAVIDYVLSHQTSSFGSEDIIAMKASGLSDEDLLSAIKADLYRPETKSTALEEAELAQKLKESGMSDEAVLQFLNRIKISGRVHRHGTETIEYGRNFERPSYPVTGAIPPGIEHYTYDPLEGLFYGVTSGKED